MGSGDNVIQIGSEKFRLLPWADPFAADSETGPPNNYYSHARDTYSAVCNDTSSFLKAYATYAGTFEAGSFLRRLSFILSWDRAAWVRRDFNRYLNGGRMCPEGTAGYEKFMPQGQDIIPRSVARALLGTHIFHYDTKKRKIIFNEEVLDLDFDSERARRKLALRGGFREIKPDDLTNIYRNDAGDFLAIRRQAIAWSSADNKAKIGIHIIPGNDALSEHIFADHHSRTDIEMLLVRNGTGGEFPLIEHAEEVAAYLDGIKDDSIPSESKQLPLKDILAVFGYMYSGSNDATAVGDYFYKVATNYEAAVGTWLTSGSEEQETDVRNKLSYNAAEQYYLAVATSLATSRFVTALGMISQMEHHLRKAGIEPDDELRKVEDAINRLGDRLCRRKNGGPQNSGGVAGDPDEEIINADGQGASTTAAMSIEVAGIQDVGGLFGLFSPWQKPVFTMVGAP